MTTNNPDFVPFVCPHDGTTSEDMAEHENGWLCPTCERIILESELVSPYEYIKERRYDARVDSEVDA